MHLTSTLLIEKKMSPIFKKQYLMKIFNCLSNKMVMEYLYCVCHAKHIARVVKIIRKALISWRNKFNKAGFIKAQMVTKSYIEI